MKTSIRKKLSAFLHAVNPLMLYQRTESFPSGSRASKHIGGITPNTGFQRWFLHCRFFFSGQSLLVPQCWCLVLGHRVDDGTYTFSHAIKKNQKRKFCFTALNLKTLVQKLQHICWIALQYWSQKNKFSPGNLWFITFNNSTRKKGLSGCTFPQVQWQSSIVRHNELDELKPHMSPELE